MSALFALDRTGDDESLARPPEHGTPPFEARKIVAGYDGAPVLDGEPDDRHAARGGLGLVYYALGVMAYTVISHISGRDFMPKRE